MTRASTGHFSPVGQVTTDNMTQTVAYSAHLYTFGQHDDGFNTTFPHHSPEMINSFHQRSCRFKPVK